MARVLVVDDEEDIVESLRMMWRSADIEVLTATGGKDALRLLETESVDLVVTDQRMPGMSGLQLLEEVLRRHPGTRVAMMTAYPDDELERRVQGLGGVAFLRKPGELDEWGRLIEDAMRPAK